MIDNSVGKTIFRNTIAEVTAGFLVLFINVDSVSQAKEGSSSLESGRAATDNGDLFAVGLAFFENLHANLALEIGDESLDTANINGTIDTTSGATFLAISLSGAYTGADGTQGVILANGLGSTFERRNRDTPEFF